MSDKRRHLKETPEAIATRMNKKAMIAALKKSLGIVSTAVLKVGINRATHYKWLDSDPEYKAAAEEVGEEVLDFAESKLFQNVNDGKEASVFFLLKCRGKGRGYVERQELEHNIGNGVSKFVFELHGDETGGSTEV